MGTYTVAMSFNFSKMGPRITADIKLPMIMAHCCDLGVAPSKYPVFRSCDVVPPFEEAMHTMPPTDKAVT